ncbi:response regulator [Emticicia sp. BO119]|uniref:response regulator n=1 Tax=Emticicia sp. BO119 TaxID=2757768 RepID=UPI0015F1098D|nr:response regulator [Emticicia sp. BO119]MBA4848885.1 response regulator [Emticicia sp. BO119]
MKKILLIEDNAEIRENTSEILELDGYEVLLAENGKVGVDLALKEIPDLIICDIMMPVLDGYGVLHLLSKQEKTATIPFIFLSAKAERTDLRKGMDMGADDYITKPFDDVELLSAIESRLRKKEVSKKHYSQDIAGLDQLIADANGEQELKKLTENREVRYFKKKTEIYREGDFPLYLYYIQKGKIKAFKTNDDGKEFIVNLYNAGDFVGYVDLIQETNFTDTTETLEETEICLIPKKDFYVLLHQNPQVAQKFIQLLSKNIKANEENLLKLAYNSVRKRVSEALLRFYQDNLSSMKISREDLASAAGTSLETAIRTLSDFRDEKLIEVESGRITILNIEKLKRLRN